MAALEHVRFASHCLLFLELGERGLPDPAHGAQQAVGCEGVDLGSEADGMCDGHVDFCANPSFSLLTGTAGAGKKPSEMQRFSVGTSSPLNNPKMI